jgi:hypothetical protein
MKSFIKNKNVLTSISDLPEEKNVLHTDTDIDTDIHIKMQKNETSTKHKNFTVLRLWRLKRGFQS